MPTNNTVPPPAPAVKSKSAFLATITGRLFWPLVVLMMIIPWLLFYFIFFSVWRDIVSGKNELSGLTIQRDLRAAQDKLDEHIAHAKELGQYPEADLKKFPLVLPKIPEVPELLVQLEAFVTEAGLANPKFTLDKKSSGLLESPKGKGGKPVKAESGPVSEVVANSLELSGNVYSYEHAKSVIDLIERNLRLMDILSVAYSPKDQALTIIARTYSLP